MKQVDYDLKKHILIMKFSGADFKQSLELMKMLVGSTFIMAGKYWTAPAIEMNIFLLNDFGWELSPTAKALLFKKKDRKKVHIDKSLIPYLYPFQLDGVTWLEENDGMGIISDEVGCGKSAQSISYAKLHPDYRPVLVVCPASVKLHWRNEIQKWSGESEIKVLYGRSSTPLSKKEYNWYIANYDIMGEEEVRYDEDGHIIVDKKGNPKKFPADTSWYLALAKLNIKILILDEVQMISHNSGRTRAIKNLKKLLPDVKIIALSGTPIRNRPLEFFNILNLIAPDTFPSLYKFQQKYCCPQFNGFGWTFNGASNLEELHEMVKPFMIRRLKADILQQLPPKVLTIVPLELEEVDLKNYNNAEEEFKKWLETHYGNFLTIQEQMERLKQLAYLAKRNAVLQWIDDFLTTGEKLVVMTYHKMAMDDIYGKYKKVAVKLDGSTSHENRQKAIEKFQSDDSIKLFVGQILAAGVGIDGLQNVCSTMAVVEFTYTPADHAQAEGRIQRITKDGKYATSVDIFYLVADGTIENDLVKMIVQKHKVTKKILDGKSEAFFDGQEKNLVKELSEKYMVAKL